MERKLKTKSDEHRNAKVVHYDQCSDRHVTSHSQNLMKTPGSSVLYNLHTKSIVYSPSLFTGSIYPEVKDLR